MNYGSMRVADFFVRGSAKLNNNDWILCPQEEVEIMKEENPNVNVIGYEGENVINYTNKFMKLFGYQTFTMGEHGYIHDSLESYSFIWQKEYEKDLMNRGINVNLFSNPHFLSWEKFIEMELINIDKTNALYKLLKTKNPEIPIGEVLKTHCLPNIYSCKGTACELDYENAKEQAIEKGVDFLKYQKQLRKELVPLGISDLQFESQNFEGSMEQVSKRILRNISIEKFLEIDITEQYEEDMVITNIKRIKSIKEKMQNEKLYGDNEAEKALEYVAEFLIQDLHERGELYKEQKEEDGIDWTNHQQKLDKMLLPLGLDCKYFLGDKHIKSEDILQKMNNNDIIKDFMVQNGIQEVDGADILSKYVSMKEKVNEIEIQETRELDQIGKDATDIAYESCVKVNAILTEYIASELTPQHKEYIEKTGKNWEQYLLELKPKLSAIGMTIEDFMQVQNKNNLIKKMDKFIDNRVEQDEQVYDINKLIETYENIGITMTEADKSYEVLEKSNQHDIENENQKIEEL